MEREVDPNTVAQEARSGEQTKGELYLKADYKNQKQTNAYERQSSNQGRDKVAKQKYKVQIKVKVQIKHGKKCKKTPKHTKQETGA